MDVFMEILKVQYIGPKYRKLTVRWWNVGFTKNPWVASDHETIKILNEDWNTDWMPFDPLKDIHPGRAK